MNQFKYERLENDLEHWLPTEMRYLKWDRFPMEFLPLSSQHNNLIGLHMCHSNLKQFWLGNKHLKNLKYINLNHSKNLTNTPNFEEIPNLERLELEGCTSLIIIHPSIFAAKNLIFLNLKDCINLTNLPTQINIKSLQVLILSGCSKLKNIPQFSGNTNALVQLCFDHTSITEHEQSTCDIMTRLFLCVCRASMADDSPIGVPLFATLFSLTKLNLSYCNLKSIPEGIECLVSLTELNLSGNKFSQLPTTISQLQNLKRLNLNRCKKLLCIPELPPRILRILSKDCGSLVSIPEMLKTEQLYFMTELNLMNCYQLGGNKKLQRLIVSWMQSMLLRNGAFNVMIPGSEIPDWFTTKMGSSITVEWDPTAPNSNLIRFALCVVCGGGDGDGGGDVSGSIIASVAGRSPDEGNLKKGDVIVNGLTISGMRKMDHIWLFVLARTQLLRRKMKGFREIEFRFLLQVNYGGSVSKNIELKRCGVGFINMEEEEEAMKRYAACIILKNKMRM